MDLTRGVGTALMAQIGGGVWHPVLMVDLDWPGGRVRAHSGVGVIEWASATWAGVGKYGEVSIPEEAANGLPSDFSLSLVCDLPDLATYADAVIRGRPGTVYLGATTAPGGNLLVGNPVALASGTMDGLVLMLDAQDGVQLYRLTVSMTTGPSYRSASTIVHSHEDQSRKYPGDTAGLRLIGAMSRARTTLWPEP